jgi:histidinol-phosphate/aromatic aminotransferase/cobyric acid decarboxylase-like protein/choline kinase
MQAIILAAGMGKRLGEYTKDNTKCMLPVNGVRLIDRTLTMLGHLKIDRCIIVVGYQAANLMEYIGHRYDDSFKIEFLENPVYDKTNNIYSLSLAGNRMAEDDTLLLESDLIYEESMLRMLVDNPYPNLALVAKYESWMDGTVVRINEFNEIVNFVPKEAFDYEEADHYYKTVNIYKFSREFSRDVYLPFLNAYSKVMGNNEYYEQVLRVITHLHKSDLRALPLTGQKWYEIDDVQDLDIASTIFSDGVTKYHEYHKRYGGFWRFPQLLDYCYLVNPYFPTKRMLDEMRANFETLLREYPSGMYVNSLLAGKYFGIRQDYVVVGNGAAELIKVVMEEHTGKLVGVQFPTFDEYPNRLQPEQIVPFSSGNSNFSYTVDELMAFYADKNLSLLLLINPDNPSGHFIPTADVLRLADWCRERQIRLIVDESFVDFTDGFEQNSLLHDDILEQYPGMMVMKSISKSYGVPGLRLGVFASADTGLIARIKKEVSIWNINSFGEYYMQIFGKYEKDYQRACRQFVEERTRFYDDLQTIPFLRVIPSQANYFLCEVTERFTATELTQRLIENDVIVSNCSLKRNMGEEGRQLIRLAIRDRKDDEKLVKILKSI